MLVASGATLGRHLVYCKLLRAGYIVQRHPARWLLRPAEDPAQVWAAWGQAQPSQLQESNQQSNQQQQLPGALQLSEDDGSLPAPLPIITPVAAGAGAAAVGGTPSAKRPLRVSAADGNEDA